MSNGRGEGNGLGLAGFIIALLGFVGTCGLLSPIGLILSLVALRKEPRGFAIAGTIIGLLGSLWAILGVFVFGAMFVGVLALALGAGFVVAAFGAEFTNDANALAQAVEQYRQDNNGVMPSDLGVLTGLQTDVLQDPFGNPYRLEYDADAGTYRIFSNGFDGQANTDDDIQIYPEVSADFEALGGSVRGSMRESGTESEVGDPADGSGGG